MSSELNKKLFLVSVLETKRPMRAMNIIQDLSMSWAEGMVGVMPVFDSEESALKYNSKRSLILTCESRK